MFNRPKAYVAIKIRVTSHDGDPLAFPSFLSRSFPVTSSTPSLMASKLRPAMSLCRNSFRSIVVFAKKGLSVRYWLNAGELAELKRYSVEQAERWGNFTPKDPDALLIAMELTAAYRNNAESERDAACWASEMAKWESAAGHPQLEQRRRTQKEVQELLEGVLSRIVHCQQQGVLADAGKFWNTVASKRKEEAKKFSSLAKVEPDNAVRQALTEKAKEAEAEAKTALKNAMIFTLLWYLIPGFIVGVALGWSPRRRIKLLQWCRFLSEQETEFAKIVESNDGVPAVLTNFRGCRKSTVCKRYEAHAWLIGRQCVYISRDPEKKTSSIEVLNYVLGHAPSIAHIICFVAMLPAVWYPRLAATAAVGFGLLAPAHAKPGVVIFDDVTSQTTFRKTAGATPSAVSMKGAADDKAKLAEYTNIPAVVGAAYKGRKYDGSDWIQIVVSSNEGILLLQRDMNKSKYGYRRFPTASAEELRGAIKAYIKEYLTESKKKQVAAHSPKLREEDFPPPTVDEIERAVDRYGEWWGRSIRFWILPFNNNDAGFHERMRSAELDPEDIGKLAAELDLMCSSGPAPLIGSPPIDVSEFNKAFAFIGGNGLLEDAVRGLYGNNKVVDVNHFPRRLLHSVMYSLVTTEPVEIFKKIARMKLAELEVDKHPVPLLFDDWELSRALLSPLGRGWLREKEDSSLSQGKDKHQTERQEKKGTQN